MPMVAKIGATQPPTANFSVKGLSAVGEGITYIPPSPSLNFDFTHTYNFMKAKFKSLL